MSADLPCLINPKFHFPLNQYKRTSTPLSVIDTIYTQDGTKELTVLGMNGIFDFPKPAKLIKEFIKIRTKNDTLTDDIILDFFAGSGTTAQAVLELNKEDGGNRKFILVQLPEKTAEDSEAYKAGYLTIADICKERIRRVIRSLTPSLSKGESGLFSDSSPDSPPLGETQRGLGFNVFKLAPSNFKHWRSDLIESEDDLNKMIDLFDTQLKPGAQELNMLYELMLKSGYTLTDKIEEKNGPSSPAGEVEASFYLVAGKLAVVLNKIDQPIIDEILAAKPQTCIILDNLFAGNDQLKTNAALQMKDAGVEMVTL
jgi:adenine-specific DNA-methyltransferase